MTLIRTIIADALRESGILALGNTPEAASEDEGLRRLNVLVKSLIGNELGDKLTSLSYGLTNVSNAFGVATDSQSYIESSYVPANTRLYLNLAGDSTAYLDPNPFDGARLSVIDIAGNASTNSLTLNANGRHIEGAASVLVNTDNANIEWFYRADLGSWVKVTDLVLNDESPFPSDFDDLLVIMLALRLNPRYGQKISGESQSILTRARSQFRARYSQKIQVPPEAGIYRLPSRIRGMITTAINPSVIFNKGLI